CRLTLRRRRPGINAAQGPAQRIPGASMPGGVWLIANPQAGRKVGLTTNPSGPDDALAALRRVYPAAELHLTERAGHATEQAREAVRAGAELVVAAGGDGTVREVACGLI